MGRQRFVADRMLGSLTKKLRLLGIDTAYSNNTDHSEIKYITHSQRRTLLTRDENLARNMGERAWLVKGSDVREEFLSISERLAPFRGQIKPFSMCLDCNGQIQTIDPADAEGKVPPYIYHSKRSFTRCQSCLKVYWEGTHRKKMEDDVKWMEVILQGEGCL